MENENQIWDSVLDSHGIDGLILDSDGPSNDTRRRRLTFIFTDTAPASNNNDLRIRYVAELISNQEQTDYRIMVVPDELAAHGIDDVWVITEHEPINTSWIFVKFLDVDEAIRLIRHV